MHNAKCKYGFGSDSTHMKDKSSIFSEIEVREITDIKHPNFVLADQEADLFTSKLCFGNINIFKRAKSKVLRVISKIIKI